MARAVGRSRAAEETLPLSTGAPQDVGPRAHHVLERTERAAAIGLTLCSSACARAGSTHAALFELAGGGDAARRLPGLVSMRTATGERR